MEIYSPQCRRMIDDWGFYPDNPPASVYGPLTPVPPGTDKGTVFRPPASKLGLGAKPENEEEEQYFTSDYALQNKGTKRIQVFLHFALLRQMKEAVGYSLELCRNEAAYQDLANCVCKGLNRAILTVIRLIFGASCVKWALTPTDQTCQETILMYVSLSD